jgi:hypothetical protein
MDNISIVIQGPIAHQRELENLHGLVGRCHKLFNGAEIIISTWSHCHFELSYLNARIVYSDDPGILSNKQRSKHQFQPVNMNTKRMLVSSLSGVKAATGTFVLKLRADINFGDESALDIEIKHACVAMTTSSVKFALLDRYTRSPEKSGLLYHGSDILYFGYKNDIETVLSQSLQFLSAEEEGKYYLCPEQYLWLPYFTQDEAVLFKSAMHFQIRLFHRWQNVLSQQIIILDSNLLDIKYIKKETGSNSPEDCVTVGDENLRYDIVKKTIIYLFIHLKLKLKTLLKNV